MRNVRIDYLDADLRAKGVPIAGIMTGVESTDDYAGPCTFIPFARGYIRLDWLKEPTEAKRQNAVEIIREHFKGDLAIELNSLVDRGFEPAADYPKKPSKIIPTPPDELFPWPPLKLAEQKIVAAIDSALLTGARFAPNLPGTDSAFPSPRFPQVQVSQGSLQSLAMALRAEPSLVFFENGNLHAGPLGGHHVDMTMLAHWLLSRSLSSNAQKATEELQCFLDAPGTPVTFILAFGGVRVTSTIDLGGRRKIVSWDDVPACDAKQQIDDSRNAKRAPGQLLLKPSGAVVAEEFYYPKMTHSEGKWFPKNNSETTLDCDTIATVFNSMHMALDCLAVSAPCAPQPLLVFQVVPAVVPLGTCFGGASGSYVPEILSFRGYQHPDIVPNEVASILRRYSSLSPDALAKLRIPLDRLRFAMQRNNPVDRALEVGIAFESLIMHSKEGEITFKLSQRVAWLLGRTTEERLNISTFIKDFYGLRSEAIHEGTVPVKAGKPKQYTEYLLDEAIELCARAIRKIIELGGFPDWGSLLCGGGLALPTVPQSH